MGNDDKRNHRGKQNIDMGITKTDQQVKKSKVGTQLELLLSKPLRMESKTIRGHIPTKQTAHQYQTQDEQTQRVQKTQREKEALPRELLDNGQGKSTIEDAEEPNGGSKMEISTNDSTYSTIQGKVTLGMGDKDKLGLLHPPIIEATGKIAT